MSAPSGYTALDFVGFTDKGTYSPIVKYMRNDLVHYGGNIMRCKVDDTMNVTPVEGANWELWVGASANLVERVIAPLENNPADVAFGVGRQIIYDDWLWEVIAPIAVGDALIDYAVDPTNANIKKSAPVETQLLAVKAEADATDNMIAPTEASASSSSAAYSVGDQLILNNILYDVIAAIQIGDALTTGTGGNIAAADTLTEQLAAKANSSDLAAVATSGAYSDLSGKPTLATVATSGSYNDLSNKPTLGTAAAKNSTNAVTQSSTDLVESGAVYSEVNTVKQALTTYEKTCNNHNIPRLVPKDISSYISDGTFYKRLNGTDGFTLFEDIYVGDYIKMSRAITAPNQDSQYAVTGSQYVTIIGLDTLMKNNGVSYHHAVMTAGQGFGGTQHFGRKIMYASIPFTLGYVGSEMNTDTLGSVASSGSTASGATINQQLYAEFGSHLKTTSELLSTANNSTGVGRFGTASGCATNWAWTSVQAVLMSEIEVYGSVVWGASGYDIGTAKEQFPLFAFSKEAMNNGSAYYWLKDIASGSRFCVCYGGGDANYDGATYAGGCVRPRFVIGA